MGKTSTLDYRAGQVGKTSTPAQSRIIELKKKVEATSGARPLTQMLQDAVDEWITLCIACQKGKISMYML